MTGRGWRVAALACRFPAGPSARADNNMRADYHGQRWTVWFIWKKVEAAVNIHPCLVSKRGGGALPHVTVFTGWEASLAAKKLENGTSSSQPPASPTPASLKLCQT